MLATEAKSLLQPLAQHMDAGAMIVGPRESYSHG